jgi:hypothetical protein
VPLEGILVREMGFLQKGIVREIRQNRQTDILLNVEENKYG